MVQGLTVGLPIQGMWVQPLVQRIPHTTEPVSSGTTASEPVLCDKGGLHGDEPMHRPELEESLLI